MGKKHEKILWGRIFQNKIIFKIPLALLIIAYFWRARRYGVFMFSNWGMYDSFFSFRFISTILNQKRNCSYATLEELTDEENQSNREEPYLLSLCIMNRQWASIDPCLTANSKKKYKTNQNVLVWKYDGWKNSSSYGHQFPNSPVNMMTMDRQRNIPTIL